MTYKEIVKAIEKSPTTQLVALFCDVTGECVNRGCFKPGGMTKAVARIENRIAEEEGKAAPNPEVISEVMKLTCRKCGAIFTLDGNYIHRRCGLNGCEGKLHKV